jgi:hypothetical protein
MVFLGVVLRQNKIKSMGKISLNIRFIGRISQYFASKKYQILEEKATSFIFCHPPVGRCGPAAPTYRRRRSSGQDARAPL